MQEIHAKLLISRLSLVQNIFYHYIPAMKENDIRLLCYIFTGFSPQVISLFTKESVANIYARKSRLKSRIKAAGTPHTDLFLSLFG